MTTVAFDGKTLAADRRCISNGTIRTTNKLFDCGEYWLAIVGSAGEGVLLAEYIQGGMAGDPPELDDDYIYGLAVKKEDGSHYAIEKGVTFVPIVDDFQAEGSGREFAMAAMAMGMGAKEAVEFAARFDASTGNGVDSVDIWAD